MRNGILIHRYALYIDYGYSIRSVASSESIEVLEKIYNDEVTKIMNSKEYVKPIIYIYDYDKDTRIKEFDYDTDIS